MLGSFFAPVVGSHGAVTVPLNGPVDVVGGVSGSKAGVGAQFKEGFGAWQEGQRVQEVMAGAVARDSQEPADCHGSEVVL